MKESESKNIIAGVRIASTVLLWLLATSMPSVADRPSAPVAHQLARYLEPASGFTLRVVTGGAAPGWAISLRPGENDMPFMVMPAVMADVR